MKDVIDEVLERTQGISDRITDALNPIKPCDLPLIVFSMQKILSELEKDMNITQRKVVECLKDVMGVKATSVFVSKGSTEALKQFDTQGGEIVNGI